MPRSRFGTDGPTGPGGATTVLVGDDMEAVRVAIAGVLRRLGARTAVVRDGQQAVAEASRVDYDVVLLDLRMPGLDGLGAARAIRRVRGPRRPRLVAMTAEVTEADRVACLEAGFEAVLPKPTRAAELARVLGLWVPAMVRPNGPAMI